MDTLDIAFLELFNSQVQYVVPRWQRRYCWGQADIERLVEDLITVGKAKEATHYGGTLLTYPESHAVQPVRIHRVVDGQQRLTTVSILLACIAEELGPNGQCSHWTRQIIRDDRLTNPGKSTDKFRKLRLQDGDESEYRSGLKGNVHGAGAVAQAWRIARRLVKRYRIADLLAGLERFRVINIGLGTQDDPQQIFETLNATGRPLSESEKLKNWLLMGLPESEQQDLYQQHWKRIEDSLKAKYSTDRIDKFLRDFLRWKTGTLRGVRHVYQDLRRWAIDNKQAMNRPALCANLAETAALYGVITGSSGPHSNKAVERELRHLRAMGFDTHRPLTLRLLHETKNAKEDDGYGNEVLARVLAGIGAWLTRFWLSERPMAGLNTAFAELAREPGPNGGVDPAEFWLKRIRRLRNQCVAVPDDEAVRDGIRNRKAYGGSATRVTKAILCAMMESEQLGDSPARDALTVEHVMPQKLTDEWRIRLGDNAEQIHGLYRDRLANLTLSGVDVNSKLGAKSFEKKREIMANSGVQMTRDIAESDTWN